MLSYSLITKTWSAPKIWVMLEKIVGVALVTKLRAILLMEADFNYHNRLTFLSCMMDLARLHNMIPEEIFSEKRKTAEDTILQQVLVYDIARKFQSATHGSLLRCHTIYDRVAHVMMALTLRACKVR